MLSGEISINEPRKANFIRGKTPKNGDLKVFCLKIQYS